MSKSLEINAPVAIKNKFTIEVHDTATGETQTFECHNIVLNAMWSRLINFQAFFVNIHFGTGTGTFTDVTRTSLFTHLGTRAATTEFITRALPTSQWRRRIVLTETEFVGAVITEVGVAFGATTTNLVTHAAIRDAEGNPISLGPKTNTQIVTIFADIFFQLGELTAMYGGAIRWVQPLANNELLTYLLGGTYPTQQWRVTGARTLGNGTADTSHGQSANILVADWVRDAATRKATTPVPATVGRLGATIGNGAVRGFGLGSSDIAGTLRARFPITGVFTSRTLTGVVVGSGDGVTTRFNLPWNGANPASVTVRVDGIAVSPTVNELINYVGARLNNPTALPAGIGRAAAFSPDGVHLAIAHDASPFVSIYRRDGDVFTRLANPTALPAGIGLAAAFSPDGVHLAIAHGTSPFVTLYDGAFNTGRAWNIIFATPPAVGTTITADYSIPYVPKDANHVLDLRAAIQFGEIV